MSESRIRPRRSLIFAPGNKPEMFPKALKSGADIVCVDLEDAIAPAAKDLARRETLKLFRETPASATAGVECMVRINSLRSPEGLADVLAVIASDRPPGALMLPKVKSPDEITLLAELLEGPRHRGIRFHVIIETNEGLEACHAIARTGGRIDSLLFGGVDMAAELRVEPTWDALLHARATLVHAAAGAGVDLIDVPYLDLDDMAGLAREAAAAAALGMTGKGAIHPKQIPVINRAFSPDIDAVRRARRIVEAFAKSDSGLVVVDNKLIEKPVLRSMHRLLAIADKLGMTES